MIEKFCPKCKVPMMGEKCSKKECGCSTVTSSTIYWCKECNIPVFEKECPVCGHGCDYIATDIRPVFPEESALLGIILKNQFDYYLKKSIWYGSNVYIVDGEKVKISISKLNKMPIESIREIKDKYDSIASQIDYDYFNKHVNRFVEANVDRYNSITEEAVNYIQSYKSRYDVEDMLVSFSGGKDSTVTSHLVNRALGTNKVLHIFGDTTLEFPYTIG